MNLGYLLAALLLVVFAAQALRPTDLSADGRVLKRVTPAEAFAFWSAESGVTLLDVRTAAEFRSGTARGARLADILSAGFADAVEDLPRDRPLVIFCRSGNRSLSALAKLKEMGFRHVLEVSGGYAALLAAGFPRGDGKE